MKCSPAGVFAPRDPNWLCASNPGASNAGIWGTETPKLSPPKGWGPLLIWDSLSRLDFNQRAGTEGVKAAL